MNYSFSPQKSCGWKRSLLEQCMGEEDPGPVDEGVAYRASGWERSLQDQWMREELTGPVDGGGSYRTVTLRSARK
jgi:hypothetical protein